ncbi:MAG: VWA domain-containing protein [Reinekea sp.]|jgi:Ca-activated chloride channel homolog
MTFAWLWLALLLPLYWLIPARQKHDQGLQHPFLFALANPAYKPATPQRRILPILAWLCLVLALMRPQWIGPPLDNESQGRAIYLSVDLSESMLERDMSWNNRAIERFQAVQAVVKEFIEQRTEDFIGLVVFGSFAEIQSPLTSDTRALVNILQDLRPGMAQPKTAIGDGLALAAQQLRESPAQDKVIILLSDGENTSGSVTPEQGIEVAKNSDIKVYTIGFGSDGRRNSMFNLFSMKVGSSIDERTLKNIAEQTDGQYFRATTSQELIDVFDAIEKLEPSQEHVEQQRVIIELFWLPLLVFASLSLAVPVIRFIQEWMNRHAIRKA